MEELARIQEDLKNRLSEKRYQHSIGVMKRIEELARHLSSRCRNSKISGNWP